MGAEVELLPIAARGLGPRRPALQMAEAIRGEEGVRQRVVPGRAKTLRPSAPPAAGKRKAADRTSGEAVPSTTRPALAFASGGKAGRSGRDDSGVCVVSFVGAHRGSGQA